MEKLTCDMAKGCTKPVTHLDTKGYVYCARHGEARRTLGGQPCRVLTRPELLKLQAGIPLARY